MDFVLSSEHLYWWPVTVRMPDPDPEKAGQLVDFTFRMRFAAMPLDEARERQKELAALPVEERLARQHDQMKEACHDWDGVVEEDGTRVPFSHEWLNAAMQMPWFRLGVYEAYERSLTGQAARQGN